MSDGEVSFSGIGLVGLLTDFGIRDDYVGLMHAVLRGRSERPLEIIDLCHSIPPGDVRAASFLLEHDLRYFPTGAVIVCVVDPGVGSKRSILCALIHGRAVVAPDNGLINKSLDQDPNAIIYRLDSEKYSLERISNTFHGRDIFSPVAAKLAGSSRFRFEELGGRVRRRELEDFPRRESAPGSRRAVICWVDHFGNLVTDLPSEWAEGGHISVAGNRLRRVDTFSEGAGGEAVWLIGSKDTVEVVVNGGNASRLLDLTTGDAVTFHESGISPATGADRETQGA